MIYPPHLKNLVIQPVLDLMGAPYNTRAAASLCTGTWMHESTVGKYSYLRQVLASGAYGAAYGLPQTELLTAEDITGRWLALPAQSKLHTVFTRLLNQELLSEQLIRNLSVGAFITRAKYIPDPQPIPTDAKGMATYYKRIYNSSAGAAVVDASLIAVFQAAIDA